MQITVYSQLTVFLICIAVGILISLLFDIFRIRRRTFQFKNFVVYIEDILFWLICIIAIPALLYVINGGELRGYLFIGIAAGVIAYHIFISKLVIKVSVPLVLKAKQIITGLIRIIIKPVKYILVCLNKAIKYIFKKSTRYSRRTYRKVEYDYSKFIRKFKIFFFKK